MTSLHTIRLIACLGDLCLPLALWRWLRPSRREAGAALLASGWALSAAALAGVVSTYFGAAGFATPVVLGTPPDLLLSRVLLGGFCTALCFPSVSIPRLFGFAVALDLTFCMLARGMIDLHYLAAQALIVASYFIPAQMFAMDAGKPRSFRTRLTARGFSGWVAAGNSASADCDLQRWELERTVCAQLSRGQALFAIAHRACGPAR